MKSQVSKVIHEATNHRVEKLSKILYTVIGKVSPIFIIWIKFISDFIVYVTTDLGNEAFELPAPIW